VFTLLYMCKEYIKSTSLLLNYHCQEFTWNYVCYYEQFSKFLIFSAHIITSDVSLQETAKAAEFFLSDGVIITGVTTGDPTDSEHLHGKFQQKYKHMLEGLIKL